MITLYFFFLLFVMTACLAVIIFAPLTDIKTNDTFVENPEFIIINWGKKISPKQEAQWMINELKPLNKVPLAVRSGLSC